MRRCPPISAVVLRRAVTTLVVMAILPKTSLPAAEHPSADRSSPLPLRVLTYNIHHGAGTDGRIDLPRIAATMRAAKPDLVALQEVDCVVQRSGLVDQASELARLTGMQMVFGGNLALGEGAYGNAVLSRLPIKEHRNHALPRFDEGEQRGVLEVVLEWPSGGTIRVLATHLDHRHADRERVASAAEINRLARQHAGQPMLLAGDLNATPRSNTLRVLRKQWRSSPPVPTVPVDRPTRQIDYVLVSPPARWRFRETRVLEESVASDHRALLAVLELAAEASQSPNSRGP